MIPPPPTPTQLMDASRHYLATVLLPNSLRHLQHQQENVAKKRNRWEDVAAVQEARKLYFRPAPQQQKLKYILLPLKKVQMKFVSQRLPHVHFTFSPTHSSL